MSEQEPIEFPNAWMTALHPRRDGRPAWQFAFADEHHAALREHVEHYRDEWEAVLDDPYSDARLVSLVRSTTPGIESTAARVALYSSRLSGSSVSTLADEAVRTLGLGDAVVACLESLSSCVTHDLVLADPAGYRGKRTAWGRALVPVSRRDTRPDADHQTTQFDFVRVPYDLLLPLRRLLAVADPSMWHDIVGRIEPYRSLTTEQRWSASYLVPERRDWVLEDCQAGKGPVSPYVAFEPRQVKYLETLSTIVTVIDAMEHAATPLLVHSLDGCYAWSEQVRGLLIGVLARIPSDSAASALLERIDLGADVAAGFAEMASADPHRAARVLSAGAHLPGAAVLLARLRRANPDLGIDGPDLPPEAPAELAPVALVDPPWTRRKPAQVRIEITPPDPSPRIEWLDGERDEWARWGPVVESAQYRDPADAPDFYLFGPTDLVRPQLAGWAAEKANFYLRSPELLVYRFELDAYPVALRLARNRPAARARLLLPYLSAEVATVMAGWLVGSRQVAPTAREWFARHGSAAAAHLLAPAADLSTADGMAAARAVAELDTDHVRTAGRALGAEDAVERLLSRDPLDLAPGRTVKLPTWLDLGELPVIHLRDRRHVLSVEHTRTLVRLLMQSPLDEPHPALPSALERLDRDDTAAFAWALYGAWQLAGRRPRDSWVFDALGTLGNATIADRLAPRVLVWPTFGAAQRAKRGAEVLGRIDATVSLGHLSAVARTAKSTPLRKHAWQVLDKTAAERGLLPEQLEDLVAPDAGLAEEIVYQDQRYRIDLDSAFSVVLIDSGGSAITSLPTPRTEEDRTAVASWNRTRREAKKSVSDQRRRLEQAMIVQREWGRSEFESAVVAHPLLRRLARGLVWTVGGRTATLDALGDLVDLDGAPVLDTGMVRIAHPASSDLARWRRRMAERGGTPPFPQLDRQIHEGDPSRYWNTVVSAASLHGLIRIGWRWNSTGRQAMRHGLVRPLNSHTSVVLRIEPGLSAVVDAKGEPDQRIETLILHSLQHDQLSVFADLPRATRSELLGELSRLEIRAAE